ncbi:hypothetical protein SAMN05216381_3213 [Pseudomonas seleniipraecipitans]|uniref:Uncharacterized protein n=1 Tax=Phytopseudomonas seleniipraecipitans TaxID=640205 RepID=A0A1G7RP31_9GAMM|nr:hypothetical protein [Pseudomonas seleniipraecipitans]SDG12485.1 hypothetical protein SAMN05216381_3213 [Pseudomonas seleniipraecipitans]
MTDSFSEEQMRRALFGDSSAAAVSPEKPSSSSRARPPRMRITMHVSREFEGKLEVFVHDASTLSRLVAELEAKAAARKKKYRYFEVVSAVQI